MKSLSPAVLLTLWALIVQAPADVTAPSWEAPGFVTADLMAEYTINQQFVVKANLSNLNATGLVVRVGTIAELEQLIVRINRTAGVASTRTAIVLSTKWENRPQAGLG